MPEFSLPHDHGAHQHEEEVRRVLADDARFSAVAELFRSLGDPTRVRIFWLLSHREECVINIAAMLDMSSPAVSHHLRSLAENGLLESRRDGKEVYYRAPDTIEALSREFLMNTTTLKAVFKKVYGTSLAAHMKAHRMERAASLLLKTQDDIGAIARAVGYESQSRFTSAFRECYGVSPGEYRRRYAGGDPIAPSQE